MGKNKEFLYKRNAINMNVFRYSKFNRKEIFERLKSENMA